MNYPEPNHGLTEATAPFQEHLAKILAEAPEHAAYIPTPEGPFRIPQPPPDPLSVFPVELAALEDLDHRFTHYPPTGSQPGRYMQIRAEAKKLAIVLLQSSFHSREQALALTKLEEFVFWANAGIARNG